MFGDLPPFSSFSVDDLAAAKQFYGDTLGVSSTSRPEGLGLQLARGGRVFLYPKEDHVPATFTVLNFPVDDIEKAVELLADAGITFEKYPDTDDKGHQPGPKARPSPGSRTRPGNFLSVLQTD